MQHETILILDFGSQYTQLIARRLRELGVKTLIERGDLGGEEIISASPIAIVLSGGYGRDINDTVEAHLQTIQLAVSRFRGG